MPAESNPMATSGALTGAHVLAQTLERLGVVEVFTIAGDHVLPLLDVMADGPFRFIDTRHESAAAHMADAFSRISGRPGVVISTTPGFANVVPALANALHAEAPMLSISGSAPLSHLGRGAMQEIDQVGMARPVTKLSAMVTDPRRIPDTVAHALRVALSGRRGPVHLTVPVDVQQAQVDGSGLDYLPLQPPPATRANQTGVRQAIELMAHAQRPVAIAGSAAAYGRSGEALARFAEITRTPVMTEGDARGLIPDEHPWCGGFYDLGLNRAAKLVPEADLVVLVGRRQDLTMGYALPPTIGANAKIIQIDPDPGEIGRNRPVDAGLLGDVDTVLGQLADEASGPAPDPSAARFGPDRSEWLERMAVERREMDAWLQSLDEDTVPMHAMSIFKELRPLLSDADGVTFEGGDFCHFGRAYLPANSPLTRLYFSTFGMLGASMGTVFAMKLARPESKAILVTGDGAFGFNAMELDTAVRHNIPITVIVGNDAAWGIDRQIQLGAYGRVVATDLLPTRYDLVAQGLGAEGIHVTRRDELGPALQSALGSNRPTVVNVEISRTASPRGEMAVERWKAGGN
jgi:acetolactate synthase-1/2/3 large subunit